MEDTRFEKRIGRKGMVLKRGVLFFETPLYWSDNPAPVYSRQVGDLIGFRTGELAFEFLRGYELCRLAINDRKPVIVVHKRMSVEDLLNESIKHWEAMLDRSLLFPDSEKPHQMIMLGSLEETWTASFCYLCRWNESEECGDCPLATAGYGCNSPNSLWKRVNNAKTWAEWRKAAQRLIEVMEELKNPSNKVWKV